MPYQDVHKARFTRADLEEYARSYEEIPRTHHHQHEGSYAQSEGNPSIFLFSHTFPAVKRFYFS